MKMLKVLDKIWIPPCPILSLPHLRCHGAVSCCYQRSLMPSCSPRRLSGDPISIPGVMPSCSSCSPSVAVWSLALACIDRWREHVASCHSLTLTRGTAGPRQLQTGGINNLSIKRMYRCPNCGTLLSNLYIAAGCSLHSVRRTLMMCTI